MVKEKGVEVEWKSFELRPEGIEAPPKSPEYIARVRAGIESMSKQYGIEMKPNTESKHSRRALEGAKFAEEYGKGNEYHDAVFAAQFQHNQNVNDVEVLVTIADRIGLDKAAFRKALEERKYRSAVLDDVHEAEQIGITGIPCFISGNRGVMGAQSYESLLQLVEGE